MIRRFSLLVLLSIALVAALLWFYPTQAGVMGNKMLSISVGALMGYLADRAAFPYARPHMFASGPDGESALQASTRVSAFNLACIRRAVIIGAATMAMALAL